MPLKTFKGKLVRNEHLTEDVILMSFSVPDFKFRAGQYVMIKVSSNDMSKQRMYSILSPPSQKNQLDFCIKVIEEGFATPVLEEAEIGTDFEFKGPLGDFVLDESCNDHWFIATGTGVAPMYSMLMEHLPISDKKTKFSLIAGFRYKSSLLFHREFLALEKKYPNFRYYPTLSREENWNGCKGHVQECAREKIRNYENKTFYICGLKEMVLGMQKVLEEKGVSKDKTRFERYS